jgi:hypothetical protein
MRVIKPPHALAFDQAAPTLFAAGSIEMGDARDWQSDLATALADVPGVLLNPRRDGWDKSWRQDIADDNFRAQVEWELDGQERAGVIAMWFEPDTRSPMTLLELGLWARSGKLCVGCPEGYWRRGNIQVVCNRYSVTLTDDWSIFVAHVRRRLGAGLVANPPGDAR